MAYRVRAGDPAPPLGLIWRSDVSLSVAQTGPSTLYGITPAGKAVALNAADGTQRWISTGTYLPSRLARQGTRLLAYRDDGLVYLDDMDTNVQERLVVSFGVDSKTAVNSPVLDDRLVYLAVERGLYVIHQDQGLQFGAVLGKNTPYVVGLVGNRDIVAIDGKGLPTRYHVGADKVETTWIGDAHGVTSGAAETPFVIAEGLLVLGVGPDTVAYDLATGAIRWHLQDVPAHTLRVDGDTLFTGYYGMTLAAVNLSEGRVLWRRQYVYDYTILREHRLEVLGNTVYVGGVLNGNPDAGLLMAFEPTEGAFAWMSRAVSGAWVGGLPVAQGNQLFVYGGDHTGAYGPLAVAPRITPETISVTPRPLRGPAGAFGQGSIRVDSPAAVRISIAAWRERTGLATPIINGASWSAGQHEVSWTPQGNSGYTDSFQFGYLQVDVEESSGMKYTQSLLLPVNTFPDVIFHWSRAYVETMVYNKFVGGYPDQLFRPDNRITRAETSTIIAKTLGLEGPSPGFHTSLTDIAQHWARNYIMALEERGIVSGFAEPDGTFTFRPELSVTRGQEAKILVRAYQIPSAPAGFKTRFVDILNHWARPDIEALESAGYVNGYEESDGTFTYRPEQNLSRAELCALVVRIRNLHR